MWLSRTLPHLITSEPADATGKSVWDRVSLHPRRLRPLPQLAQEHELEMDVFFGLTGALSTAPRVVDLPNGHSYVAALSAEVAEAWDLSAPSVQHFGPRVCAALYEHPKIRSLAGFCFFSEFAAWLETVGLVYPLRQANATAFAWVVWRFAAERNLWKYVAFNHFVEGHPELKVCAGRLVAGAGGAGFALPGVDGAPENRGRAVREKGSIDGTISELP